MASDLELFEQYLEKDIELELPDRGDLRKGVIVEIRPSELLVNIGSKRDGVVPQSDLARMDQEYIQGLSVGDEVDVVVSKQTDDDGIFQLSMADAQQQRDWLVAQELLDNGETTTHKVVGYNKGGLTVEFNRLRGFVPASHILDMPRNLSEEQRQAEFERRIGDELRLKVIEVDRKRRRLVMSQMLAEREYRASRKEELFRTLQVGDVINGEVRSLRPFGAFVDLGGADGLLHVSEIGWTPISHPREALEVGQKVDVQVIRLDAENQRIALSRKRVMANPWDKVEENYHPGEIVTATITRLVEFGAFAQLEPGVEGLIHISELADITVAEPLKTVRSGDKVQVKVLRVDGKRQRIGLSRRQVEQLPPASDDAADDAGAAESDQGSRAQTVDWVPAEPAATTQAAPEASADDSNADAEANVETGDEKGAETSTETIAETNAETNMESSDTEESETKVREDGLAIEDLGKGEPQTEVHPDDVDTDPGSISQGAGIIEEKPEGWDTSAAEDAPANGDADNGASSDASEESTGETTSA